MEYLNDLDFLTSLMENRHRTVYAKIILLNLDGTQNTEVVGYVTGGSINVDGSSAVRRSCNITMITKEVNINDNDWTLRTRFQVQIGLLNTLRLQYPNYGDENHIVWFPQGTFVITSFSSSLNTNSYTLNIGGQDKMCLLNGEVSGTLTAETDFGSYTQVYNDGTEEKILLTIKEIIWSAIHTYAQEPNENIIVDIPDDMGLKLLEYRGDKPLYLLITPDTQIENMTIYADQKSDFGQEIGSLSSYWEPGNLANNNTPTAGETFPIGGTSYQVRRIEYGETAGYEKTDLVYAGDLIAAVGETVVSILDKIKAMLGDYEYFYDIDGKFVFQRKKTYLKTFWNDDKIEIPQGDEQYAYIFNDLSLFTAVSDAPNLKNVKNDFSVWGVKKSITGNELPIHMRIAIDVKPIKYFSPWQEIEYTIEEYDWRELIYQMAIDYYAHNKDADFEERLSTSNPDLVIDGRTGYEQYYTDLQGFWRQLYNPYHKNEYKQVDYRSTNKTLYTHPWIDITDQLARYPENQWYVSKDGVFIRWLDSLALIPNENEGYTILENGTKQLINNNPISLRNLYVYNTALDTYTKLLDQSLLKKEKSYYVKEILEDGTESIIPLSRSSWSRDVGLEKLYYKNLTKKFPFFEPLVSNRNIMHLLQWAASSSGLYLNGLYLNGTDLIETLEIVSKQDRVITYTANHEWRGVSELKALYDALNNAKRVRYNTQKGAAAGEEMKTWGFSTKGQPLIYLKEIRYKSLEEEPDYGLYIDNLGQKTLLTDYLSNHLLPNRTKILDEFDIYTIHQDDKNTITYNSPIDTLSFKRDELRVQVVKKIEGATTEIEIITYQPFYTQVSPENETIYTIASSSYTLAPEVKPQFETYYATNWKGELLKDIAYKRPIAYYQSMTPYGPDAWHEQVYTAPENLLFWFNFLDPTANEELTKYACRSIGIRNLAKNDNGVGAIYYPKAPNAYYGTVFQLPTNMQDYFTISSQKKSAYEELDTLLYNHTYVADSLTLTSVPLYNLTPNVKIKLEDTEHNLTGDYLIDKLSIPLNYNGTMTINLTKAPAPIVEDLDEND